MPKFEGCVEAKEISLTRKGANQHAHVLIRKNAEPAPGDAQPKLETTQMTDAEKKAAAIARDLEVSKIALAQTNKIVGMTDVTKAHYLGLDADAQLAFLEKSGDDMAKEAEAAKAAAEKTKLEEDAAKSGKTTRELELEKRLDTQSAEIETLKAAQIERDLEKRADAEFAGFPGGSAKVIPLLKAYAKLPEDERKASEDMLKAQCLLATGLTKTFGGRTEEGINKADTAAAKIEKAAKEYQAEHKCSYGDAYEAVTEMPEFAEDVAAIG